MSSAEASGASAVVVFNDLDAQAAWMVGWMVSCGCFLLKFSDNGVICFW